jgi:diguanylate cyclase (GGDEF)-like protein
MNLLVISRHDDLVERLRMAFEGAGHRVQHAQDPLAALANDAWDEAHVLLVDALGDPMDGYRLCRLLRGESRILFSNLPIFLVLDHPPQEEDLQALQAVEGDGFIGSAYTIQQLLNHLGPVMAGAASHETAPRVPILALGLHAALAQRARDLLQHFHMEIHTPPLRNAAQAQLALRAPVLLLGLSAGGVRRALDLLAQLRESGALPYTILLGQVKEEAVQRKLLLAGVSDWVGVPLAGPRLLHACKRAIEWAHVKRIQMEYESALHDLRERRSMLEIEAAALRNEVLTDPLTGLLNRRAFDQNLEHAVHQWERHRRSFVLLLGDVDHLKLINDRFGHPVGDEVLQEMAVRIRSALRRSDLAFRIGGEEFAVLLSETTLKAGTEVADKLRGRIDEEPFSLPGGLTIFPTISFGVGGPMDLGPAELVATVDRALYQAKALGRNRVVVAVGASPPGNRVSGDS